MSWADVVVAMYAAIMLLLCGTGLHRAWLVHASSRALPTPARLAPEAPRPIVTVQLPLFNERAVVERLIDGVTALRWPHDRLEIQILDDSTDDTTDLARSAAEAARGHGLDVTVLHRDARPGFKAGALAAGLAAARGEVVAIFDADFVPPEDFLERTVPLLVGDVGLVQARWGHLSQSSWLDRAQSIALDGHFLLGHGARYRAGHWFNFNGTAGVWRREAITEAGGWQHDTLTEDLDLSYRAQLIGWRFVFAEDLVVPAELPPTMASFKAQQRRWARGGVQTARKLLGRVLRSRASLGTKVDAWFHLTGNATWPLVLLLAVLLPWMPLARARADLPSGAWFDGAVFAVAFGPILFAHAVVVWRAGGPRLTRLVGIPLTIARGVGLSISQTRAVLAGLRRDVGTFVRTPKQGALAGLAYPSARGDAWRWELLMAVYLTLGALFGLAAGTTVAVPFLVWFAWGFWVVGLTSWRELRAAA